MTDTPTTPPHDILAEQGVIGSMMLNVDVIADMNAMLRPADFYRPAHATIFETILGMSTAGEQIDMLTVASQLHESGNLMRCGGAPYLHTLIEYANAAAATSYARKVADRATDRAVGELGAKAVMLGSVPGDTDRKVSIIREAADSLAAHREIRHGTWVRDAMVPAIDAISDARDGVVAAGIIPTPYRDLNRLLGGGFRPGQSVVVGARPGIGKSTVLLDFLRGAAANGIPAALLSMEMTVPEIMQRYLSAETGIPYAMIRTGQLNADDEHRLAQRVADITTRPLLMIDNPNADMGFVRAEARRAVARDGVRIKGIDYIGLFSTPSGYDSRQLFVADVSRNIKRMSMELGLVTVTASQLNRNPAQRKDKRPDLTDLRESGAVEQDADIVILLHDPTDGDPMHARAGEYDLIVAKHRGGPTGVVTVANQMARARLADIALI